jgi:N-acetyl-gamma-glutamyl-phosphate reductase
LPSGELESLGPIRAGTVVDLSDEHRGDEEWTYGLTEFARGSLPAPRVANPGCYPTAALLSLVPFARAGAIEAPVIVDAMSGVSGAGRKAEDRFLFANLSGDVTAYGDAFHRHVPEIERGLAVLGGLEATVSFTPHLIPIPRGLVTTARARLRYPLDDAGAVAVLRDAYEGERFVRVIEQWPAAKSVAGSNGAVVSARVDRRGGWLIASAAIDNLGKGASGQALQNANLCLGFDETAGLSAAGVWP